MSYNALLLHCRARLSEERLQKWRTTMETGVYICRRVAHTSPQVIWLQTGIKVSSIRTHKGVISHAICFVPHSSPLYSHIVFTSVCHMSLSYQPSTIISYVLKKLKCNCDNVRIHRFFFFPSSFHLEAVTSSSIVHSCFLKESRNQETGKGLAWLFQRATKSASSILKSYFG